MTTVHIGTSGWHYQHWRGPFCPRDLPDERFLRHYSQHFRTAEINSTFYGMPDKTTLAQWRDCTPDGFVFAVKASRYITHMKKLKDPEQPVASFLDRVRVLGEKLGPILFQLPPNWTLNLERLRSFLDALPRGVRYAFEFRAPSWFGERTEEALSEKGAAFCIYDFAHRQSPRSVTADFVYVRLHGPDGAYKGSYDDAALSGWAGDIAAWSREGKEAFCYFDNDEKGHAVSNALRLNELIKGE